MSAFRRRPTAPPGPGLTAILVALIAIFLAMILSVAIAEAGRLDSSLREGRRVRVQTSDGELLEGVLADHRRTGLRMWCGNGPRPVYVPRHEIVIVEIYSPQPTRLDIYMGVGAFIGLGVGLLIDLQSMSNVSCDDDFEDCADEAFTSGMATIALPLLGAGVGALIGWANEGADAWRPVGVRWSSAEESPQIYLAGRF